MRQLAAKRPRAGYRTLYRLLPREGSKANHERVYRFYRADGLSLRIKRRRRRVATKREQAPTVLRPNDCWAMDFVSDCTSDGKRFRILTLIDVCTRRAPAVVVERSIGGPRVVRFLEEVAKKQRCPKAITVDNGPEFISNALDQWAYAHGVTLHFSRPGKPVDNAFIESFHGRLREECLNTNWFYGLDDARDIIGTWLTDNNEHRPHSSLAGLTPAEDEKTQIRTAAVA